MKARRNAQRVKYGFKKGALMNKYKEKRIAVKNEITRSRKTCFIKLCQEVDADPFGYVYKMLINKVKGSKYPKEGFPKILDLVIILSIIFKIKIENGLAVV